MIIYDKAQQRSFSVDGREIAPLAMTSSEVFSNLTRSEGGYEESCKFQFEACMRSPSLIQKQLFTDQFM